MFARVASVSASRRCARALFSTDAPAGSGFFPVGKMLEGVVVLELASVLAGPTAGQFLAELGAEVIKVENTSTNGDVTRIWKVSTESKENNITSYFSCCNLGKRSIAINLKKDEGLDIVHKLAAKSGVVLANYKPGDAKKLKVDYDTLREQNPGMIYCDLNGYGHDDPRPGFDAVIQAEAGFAEVNGFADNGPCKMPVALMDLLGAHQLKQALLLGLLHKERTGEGCYATVSLLGAGTSALANQATSYLQSATVPVRMGSDHPSVVPYGTVFTMSDGKQLMLAVGNDRQFKKLCALLGLPAMADDPRFTRNPDRVKHREECKTALQPKMAEWTRPALMAALAKEAIPAGAINDMADVFAQPRSMDLVVAHDSDGLPMPDNTPPVLVAEEKGEDIVGKFVGTAGVRQVAFKYGEPTVMRAAGGYSTGAGVCPVQVDREGRRLLRAPPGYAKDTDWVLANVLGLNAGEIADLTQSGVVVSK